MIGGDGLLTLALANLLMLATFGLSLAWMTAEVHRVARRVPAMLAPSADQAVELIMVLGFRLHRNAVGGEFATRLARAASLLAAGVGRAILIVGGSPGGGANSEAEAGRRRLLALGVAEHRLVKEESSRHTLENLRHARAAVGGLATQPFVLVTSRYHLARSMALARGLGMKAVPCAAEDRLRLDPLTLVRLLREAYFLHWYRVGHAWARLTDNRRSLARIT